MARTGTDSYIDLPPEPLAAVARWPRDRPLVMLHSGASGALRQRWNRWSILTSPEQWISVDRSEDDPLGVLEREVAASRVDCHAVDNGCPFGPGWIGFFSYDFGRVLEPAARIEARFDDDGSWPLYALARCPAALVFDHLTQRWMAAGAPDRVAEMRSCLETAPPHDDHDWRAGELCSSVPRSRYLELVERALGYIAAGDVFQANITQRLRADFAGSTRALAHESLRASGAHYGAYLELPDGRCLISMSPELFLQIRPESGERDSRLVMITRPIKGTRPAWTDPRELLASVKDAAELHMIVDLMRNDLGRVCDLGSVHVPVPRTIETHPTVHHGVAEVSGTVRKDVSFGEILAATFPAGSVTGAPKIRAMQVIDELEPVRRGPYCGSIGYIGFDGQSTLNVAIRTIALMGARTGSEWDFLENATLDYGAGGGVVADSDPASEYREMLDKAEVLKLVLTRQGKTAAVV